MAKMMLGDKLSPQLAGFLEVFKRFSLDLEFESMDKLLHTDSPVKDLLKFGGEKVLNSLISQFVV